MIDAKQKDSAMDKLPQVGVLPKRPLTELPEGVLLTAENYVQVTAATIDKDRGFFGVTCRATAGGEIYLSGTSERTLKIILQLAEVTEKRKVTKAQSNHLFFAHPFFVHRLDLIDTGLPSGEVATTTFEEAF